MSTMENKLQHTSDTVQTFTLKSLQDITRNFSEEHIIGRGGYGVVYKGVLDSGEEIALKKLHCIPGLDDRVFKNEFSNLMKARHKNITRLVGYCYHKGHSVVEVDGVPTLVDVEERVLCIEYLQSGGLDKYISDESRGLDWCTRYKIIKGVCEGLNYLHNGYKDPIYHMDLKPANILLDKDRTPKIGDFGLSRLFPLERTFSTTKAIGTPGYMPPEYIEKCQTTSKFDVFSLGVIIIRIVAGDEGYSKYADMSSEEFVEHVHENWRKRLLEMMTSHTSEEVITCIKIALRCVEVDRARRPTISEIVIELNKIGTIKCSPINEEGHAFKDSDEELIEDQYSSGESFVTCPSSLASSMFFSSLQTLARPQANYDFLVKLLLVGDSSVGKSKLLLRFSDTSFTTSFIATIGIDFKIRTIELDGKWIKLQIWDTAGQERFRTITTAYYRGAMGILLVYDVTDESSFNNIRRWKRNIEQHAAPDVNMILVGNITDLDESKRAITTSRGQALAYEYGINFFETCAKTNLNVDLVFFSLAREIIQRFQRPKTDSIPKDPAPESKQRHKGPLGFARELFSKKKEG